jgi:hypothetical protein
MLRVLILWSRSDRMLRSRILFSLLSKIGNLRIAKPVTILQSLA